ncbi:uncharacterized protein [Ptychodera flava]|uniref:uncharacterized protein n=1 Tax=Ptychodera flava TaxID=63121 RepID=UPI003969D095
MAASHKPWFIFLIILTLIVYLLTIAINALSGSVGKDIGLFLNSTGDISDAYYLEITPAGWTFSIWGFIYTWNMLWLIYALTTICRQNKSSYVYIYPLVMTPLFYASFIINLAMNVGWLFLWDRQYIPVAFVFLALLTFMLYVCLFITHANLYKNLSEMASYNNKEVWAIRLLVHNGIAFYATWCTIATLLNLAMTLAYYTSLSQSTASTISLSILVLEILVWFICENVVIEKYVRYTISPYIVVIVALCGSYTKNWNPEKTNSIMTVSMLGLAGLLFVVRIILLIWRQHNRPLLSEQSASPEDDFNLYIPDKQEHKKASMSD